LEGYQDLDGTARVAEALRAAHPSFSYHNLGERNLRIEEVRERQLGRALELQPDLAIVAAGGNDAFARSFDEDYVARELRSLVKPLVEHGALLVTVGLFDLPRSGLVPEPYAAPMAKRFDRLDALTAQITAEHGGVHADNHHHPLTADRGIFASDGIHVNARGHAIVAANLVRALLGLVGDRNK
jgi:lysophospholipase L1-like esterase